MKAPNLPSLSERRPVPQVGQRRGSVPSARGGKRCGASISSSASSTSRDAQVLDVVDRGGEVAPEVAQQLAPVELVVGDAVELLLQVGGEVVFDVAGEEAFQEGGDAAGPCPRGRAASCRCAHSRGPQHLQDRGVGRGPADAELLHALDQRGFRVARRRLGEVLGRGDRALGQRARRRSSPAGGATPRRRPSSSRPPGRA